MSQYSIEELKKIQKNENSPKNKVNLSIVFKIIYYLLVFKMFVWCF